MLKLSPRSNIHSYMRHHRHFRARADGRRTILLIRMFLHIRTLNHIPPHHRVILLMHTRIRLGLFGLRQPPRVLQYHRRCLAPWDRTRTFRHLSVLSSHQPHRNRAR